MMTHLKKLNLLLGSSVAALGLVLFTASNGGAGNPCFLDATHQGCPHADLGDLIVLENEVTLKNCGLTKTAGGLPTQAKQLKAAMKKPGVDGQKCLVSIRLECDTWELLKLNNEKLDEITKDCAVPAKSYIRSLCAPPQAKAICGN